ncbi:MAG: hypothetical protein RL392_34 [Pseudomonadota bacterium]|jgi:hypothetical protein
MKRASRRTHFHSSLLIRTLVDLAVLEPATPAPDLPEKLSTWISFTDAIKLSGVQKDSAAQITSALHATGDFAVAKEFSLARHALEQSIARYATASDSKLRLVLPTHQAGVTMEEASTYTPYRRYHQNYQRHLEQSARSMRSKVRNGIANVSPRLRQLAMLDSTYENILQEREASLLACLPTMFERRFHQLRKTHGHDSPDLWTKPGAWLNQFFSDLHVVLLAELDLRLQPTVGLLEALTTDTN